MPQEQSIINQIIIIIINNIIFIWVIKRKGKQKLILIKLQNIKT